MQRTELQSDLFDQRDSLFAGQNDIYRCLCLLASDRSFGNGNLFIRLITDLSCVPDGEVTGVPSHQSVVF